MRRFLPILLVFLALVSPCQGFKQSNEIADITYLLRCWPTGLTVANQSYTNGQVIDTTAEGCVSGSLTTTVADGTLATASNKLVSGNHSSSGWGECGVASNSISRVIGRAFFATELPSALTTGLSLVSISNEQSINPAKRLYQIVFDINYTNLSFAVLDGAGYFLEFGYGQSIGAVNYNLIFVLGGYNSSGVPYKSGDTETDFTYGCSIFVKKTSGDTTLIWKTKYGNAANIFATSQTYNGINTFSNLLIPNYDFSAVLQPTHLSLFATDGELSAYTPDVGSVWTESSGDWDTSSGKVVNTMAGIATFDPSLTTGMYDVTVTMPASGTTAGGLVARYTDSSNYWYVALSVGSSNNVVLNEDSGGSVTSRSTASATLNASTAYAVRLIVSSTSPYWTTYIAGVAKNSYATVGSQSTSTKFGLYDGGDINMTGFDVVGFWPLTSATYTSEFAKVGY